VVEEGVHMAPQRLCWAPQKWWGYGCTTPPCLHWYTTVVIWRRRNFFKWWHIILLCTFFLGHRRSFSYNPSPLFFFFTGTRSPSSNQSSSPQEKVLTLLPKGANSPRPLWSLLSHLHLYIFLSSYIPREVLGRRWFGFLVIPGFKEIVNMER
jgi:hypothetical protein